MSGTRATRLAGRGVDDPGEPVAEAGEGHAARRWGLAVAPAVAVLVLFTALVGGGGAPAEVAPGLPDPGPLTGWGLPVTRLVFDLSVVALIGSLVTAILAPTTGGLSVPARRALRVGGWSSGMWSASAGVLVVLTVSDVLGIPPARLLSSGRVLDYAWQLPYVQRLLLVVAVGLALAAFTRWTSSRAGVVVLLAVTVGGLLPVLFSGHSAESADHDLATSSLVVHVLAASVWVGGLAGMLLFFRGAPRMLAAVVPRYSTLALACFVAVACSGVLNAWIRTSGELSLWVGSGYGALVAVKICALIGLGYLGWMHRRHTLRALAAGRPGVFARLATVEVALMAATVGVAVALSRTPPPAGAADEVPGHGAGHPTLGSDIEPFTLTRLFTEWRVEAISLAVVVVAAACYVAGLRRLSRAGVAWPPQHTAAAAAASVVALLATSGGLGTYSTAAFSVQVAQFLALFVVVPVLVGLSAPVTLAAYASAHPGEDHPDGWLPAMTQSRAGVWLSDPLNMLIVAAVTLFGMYGTPLLEASLRSAPLHLAVNLVTLVVGVVFWWSVLGADPAVEPRARRYRLWVLGGFLMLLGAVGARIYLSDVLLAGAWFTDLGWAWLDPVVDQRRGAGLMWTCVLVLGPVLAALTSVSPRPRLPSARPDPALPPARRR